MILKSRHFKTSSNTKTSHVFENCFFFPPMQDAKNHCLALVAVLCRSPEPPREHVLSLFPACLQDGYDTRHNCAAAAI